MLESFLEPIYKKALLITDFEESIKLLDQNQFSLAQERYNSAISAIEGILPELASENPSLAERLLSCARKIAEIWDDSSAASGEIEGHLIPLLYEYMSFFTGIDVEEGKYRLISTDSGLLTLIDTSANITLHDTHNPLRQASALVDSIYSPTNKEIHIFGCDLGYLPYMLYLKSDGAAQIIIYESDKKVISYADQFGVLSWIPEECITFIIKDDPILLAKEFLDNINAHEQDLVNGTISAHIHKWKSIQYTTLGTDLIEREAQLFAFDRERFNQCVINMMRNYGKSHISFNMLKERLSREDWIIIAAGPSLDYNIDYIKESSPSTGTLAVNTVVKRLEKENIQPDLIVAADPRNQLLDHILGYEQFTKNTPLIADETTCWQYIDHYCGDICLVPTPNGKGLPLSNPDGMPIWDVYGTVVALAIESAIKLGAKKINLVGLDLAYPGGITYAQGVSHPRLENKKKDCQVKSVDGKIIDSSQTFDMFRQVIEEKISNHPEVKFINRSRYGALIKGATAPSDQ